MRSNLFNITIQSLFLFCCVAGIARSQTLERDLPASDYHHPLLSVAAAHDIALDSVLAPQGADTAFPDRHRGDSSVPVRARFRNNGTSTETNVPVKCDYFDSKGNMIYNETLSITGTIAPSEVREISTPGLSITVPGGYSVRICSNLSNDEVPDNNCSVSIPVLVAADVDVKPLPPNPKITTPLASQKFTVADKIAITVSFSNTGHTVAYSVPVTVRIYNSDISGPPVFVDTASIDIGENGKITLRKFHDFIPESPGRHVLMAFSNYSEDKNRLNDTIAWQIDVVPAGGSVRAVNNDKTLDLPQADLTYITGQPTPVQAAFINDGLIDADNVSESVVIRNQVDSVVYRAELTGASLPKSVMAVEKSFPAFTPPAPGRYCVTASIDYSNDLYKDDDTVHWCFAVAAPSSAPRADLHTDAPSLTVYPNPARDHATLDYAIAPGMPATVILFDVAGRELWKLAELHSTGTGHIAVGFDGLTSGTYTIAIVSGGTTIASRAITIQR